jgi:S1-C subfamily serine protease
MAHESFLTQMSKAVTGLYESHAEKILGVGGGPVPQRSGIAVSETRILSVARYAETGEEVSVRPAGGAPVTATVLGWDPASELAVVETEQPHGVALFEHAGRVPGAGEFVVSLAMPGEDAVEARFEMVRGVTGRPGVTAAPSTGEESGSEPTEESFIRTDGVAIPGFAGGAMIDGDGKLLAVLTRDPGGFSGFGVPIQRALSIAERIGEGGSHGMGYLGIQSHTVALTAAHQKSLGRDQAWGLLLVSVDENSPAAESVMVGDILVSLNGVETATHEELFHTLSSGIVGTTVEAEVLRGGVLTSVQLVPGERESHPRGHRRHHGHHRGDDTGRRRGGAHRRWRGMGTMG